MKKPAATTKPTPSPVAPLPPVLNITGATTVTPVEAVGIVGILSSYAREDHAHEGVHSLLSMGNPALTGDVTLEQGTGVLLGQTGNTIIVNAVFGTIPPTVVTHAGSPYTVSGGDITIFADTTAGAITIQFVGGAINTGRFVWIKNTGAGAFNVTVTATSGSVLNITSIPPGGAVLYHSDGTNWNSIMNSTGN